MKSKNLSKPPISSSIERPMALLQFSANEVPEQSTRFPFLSPLPCELESHSVLSPVTRIGASSTDFPALGSVNESKELEQKNSSLFSPLKGGDTSADVFSSPSLATSPLLKYKGKNFQEHHPPPRSETMLSVDEHEIEATCTSSAAESTSPKQDLFIVEACKQPVEVIQNPEGSVDFQTEFIRRIVHDVENNLREVLRRRFGDMIIQSAEQFLTLQVGVN